MLCQGKTKTSESIASSSGKTMHLHKTNYKNVINMVGHGEEGTWSQEQKSRHTIDVNPHVFVKTL